jgi:retron-type reverse transcriptase
MRRFAPIVTNPPILSAFLRWSMSWVASLPLASVRLTAAVGMARQRCWRRDWVLDLCIKAFFDSIETDPLMRAVRKHTECPWVLLYIDGWQKAPMQMADGSLMGRERRGRPAQRHNVRHRTSRYLNNRANAPTRSPRSREGIPDLATGDLRQQAM